MKKKSEPRVRQTRTSVIQRLQIGLASHARKPRRAAEADELRKASTLLAVSIHQRFEPTASLSVRNFSQPDPKVIAEDPVFCPPLDAFEPLFELDLGNTESPLANHPELALANGRVDFDRRLEEPRGNPR